MSKYKFSFSIIEERNNDNDYPITGTCSSSVNKFGMLLRLCFVFFGGVSVFFINYRFYFYFLLLHLDGFRYHWI
jgi:hypothetical protein